MYEVIANRITQKYEEKIEKAKKKNKEKGKKQRCLKALKL